MKKMKALLITLVLLMNLAVGVCPTFAAETTETSTASAYNVHITGNFVVGQTLTAHYTYFDENDCPEITDSVKYTWYAYKSAESTLTVLGTGSTCVLDATKVTGAGDVAYGHSTNIFVSVKTTNEKGQGAEVFSGAYGPVIQNSGNSGIRKRNAFIEPCNPKGTMEVGDKVVARFSYINVGGTAPGNHLYTWYVKDTPDAQTKTPVQAESTNDSWVITKDAYGKYIECEITPVNADGTKGSKITCYNHYGNLFFGDVGASFVNNSYKLPFDQNTYPTFPYARMLADSSTLTGQVSGSILVAAGKSYTSTTTFDMQEEKLFDGFYFYQKADNGDTAEGTKLTEMEISYSSDGETWKSDGVNVSALNGFGAYEILLPHSVSARYVKLSHKCSSKAITIGDFYPFIRNDITAVSVEGLTVENNTVSGIAAGTTVNDLLAKVSATSAFENAVITKSVIDASGATVSGDVQLTPANMSDKTLVVTGQNGMAVKFGLATNKPIKEQAGNSDSSGRLFTNTSVALPQTGSQLYLLKTEMYAKADHTISLSARMGGTNSTAYLNNILNFNNGHLYYHENKDTGYSYQTNQWYTVEVALDYKTIDTTKTLGYITINIWVDGKPVVTNYNRSFSKGGNTYTNECFTPYVTADDTTVNKSELARNSAVYEISELSVNFTESSALSFTLSDGDGTAETIAAGKTYTVADNAKMYFDTTKTIYLALYAVDANGIEKPVAVTKDGSITMPETMEGKYVLKAFSFSENLRANGSFGTWKTAEVTEDASAES